MGSWWSYCASVLLLIRSIASCEDVFILNGIAYLGAQSVNNLLQCRRPGFDPWVGKIHWQRKWRPTPVPLPGKSHGQRSLVGCSPWGHKESGTTEWQTLTYLLLLIEWKALCLVKGWSLEEQMGKLQKLDLWKLGANYTLGGLARLSSDQHGTSEHGWERQARGCPQCRTVSWWTEQSAGQYVGLWTSHTGELSLSQWAGSGSHVPLAGVCVVAQSILSALRDSLSRKGHHWGSKIFLRRRTEWNGKVRKECLGPWDSLIFRVWNKDQRILGCVCVCVCVCVCTHTPAYACG